MRSSMHRAASTLATGGGPSADAVGFHRGRGALRSRQKSAGKFVAAGKQSGYCSAGEGCASAVKGFGSDDLAEFGGSKWNSKSYGMKSDAGGMSLRGSRKAGDGDRDEGFAAPGRGNGRRNCVAEGRKNLVMEKVKILKRGESIENVAGAKKSEEEEKVRPVADNGHGGPRVSVRRASGFGENGVSGLERCRSGGGGPTAKVQARKVKDGARVSEVLTLEFLSDAGGDGSVGFMGPDPSVLSKEVEAGIVRSVSMGSRTSETSSNDGEALVNLGGSGSSRSSFGSDGFVKSGGSDPLLGPEDLVSCNVYEQICGSMVSSDPGHVYEEWAGPGYTNSPSPRCLPLPKLFMRHKVWPGDAKDVSGADNKISGIVAEAALQDYKAQVAVSAERSNHVTNQGGLDVFATRNLRRLLRLE